MQTTPSAAPASGDRAARTRLRILDAAGQCFAAAGFSKTTVEEIALGAGVSKALVYHRFRSKEEILEAVFERTFDQWEAAVRTAEDSDSALTAIRTMIHASIDWVRAHPVARALFSLEPMVVHSVGEASVRRRMEELREEFADKLRAGIASGEIRGDVEPTRLAGVVLLHYVGLCDQVMDPRWLGELDRAFVDASLDVLVRGIAAEAS